MFVAQNLVKYLGDYLAVDNVSLWLQSGEAVALVGPSGAGKTTVFKMLVGALRPDSGYVNLDGADITYLPIYERARRGLNYLPQEASLFRTMTVEQNLLLAIESRGAPGRPPKEIVDDLLSAFGIRGIRRRRAGKLSGGERRRCEIARTVANNPAYVFLDEPFAGLDPLAISDMRTAIKLLTEDGIGVLISDHNSRETLCLVNRAYVIQSGRILAAGAASDVIANPDVQREYLGMSFTLHSKDAR